MTLPASKYGPLLERGCRSMYCSPMADLLATTATVSRLNFGADFSMSIVARTPDCVYSSDSTLPTGTPR